MSHFLKQALLDLEAKNLKRTLRLVESPQGREIVVDGRKVLNFARIIIWASRMIHA